MEHIDFAFTMIEAAKMIRNPNAGTTAERERVAQELEGVGRMGVAIESQNG